MWVEKVCNGCGFNRRRDEFTLKNSRTNQRHSQCRICCRRRAKDHYQRNRAAYIQRNRRNNPLQRQRNAALVYEYLLVHPCMLCGESDPVVLEFNHADARTKVANISDLIQSGCSIERINGEIAKCEVACANCHQRLTWQSTPSHYRTAAGSAQKASPKAFRAAANARNYQLVLERLSGAVCIDCGAQDPLVLQFDHMGDKADDISWLAGSGWSSSRLSRELSKCVIRCANCHRRATAQARSWFRARQRTPAELNV
jgi:hypothetical protein